MRISIAMTTFNGERYIQEQLDSFLCQTRQPDELVVCDDGSTDATLEILERFRQQAPFDVQIYRNETNLGFTKNFEKAIANCSGDLIFLSDQDDIWFPTKTGAIEKVFLDNQDNLLVIHDGDLVDENLVSHGATKLGQVLAGYGTDDAITTGALTAIRSTLMPYVLPIPKGINGHDGWIHIIARLLNSRIVLHQSLQSIRRHSSNTSSWVASSVEKINRIDVLRSQYKSSVAVSYEDRIIINEACRRQLMKASSHENIFSRTTIQEKLNYLDMEYSALQRRTELVKTNSLNKRFIALRMLLSGQYKHFNGIKSFLRDVVR